MSISLATLGFTIAGILFLIYAFSFRKAATVGLQTKLTTYAYTYVFLGIAFILWGIATLVPGWLQTSVIIGDLLILCGSICLLDFLFANKSAKWTAVVLGVLGTILFLWWRLSYFPPAAILQNGILIFNTPLPVAIALILVFLLIWLPANLKAAKLIGNELKDKSMQSIYSYIYCISTLAAVVFVSVKTPTVAVLSFVLLGLCFVVLLYSNLIQNKLYKEDRGGK